jgi:hypothetical protein
MTRESRLQRRFLECETQMIIATSPQKKPDSKDCNNIAIQAYVCNINLFNLLFRNPEKVVFVFQEFSF